MAYQNSIASRIISSANITSSGTSAQSGRAPFGCTIVRVATSAAVNIVIGPNPTATATGTVLTQLMRLSLSSVVIAHLVQQMAKTSNHWLSNGKRHFLGGLNGHQ